MGLQSILIDALDTNTLEEISKATGVDASTVGKVVAAGAPLIVGQMGNRAESSADAESLSKAVEKDHSPSVLENITGIFTGGSENLDGTKILGHVFGSKGDGAAESLGKKFGLDSSTIVKILSFVAPLIMSALAKEKISKSLDTGGLSDLLKSEKAPSGNSLTDMAAKFLDKDDDGSIVDDLLGMFGK